ncbi:MAG: hypothetical protein BWY79_01497 [Actinobacteria bacterium ADurb.Bin444]|nr:MAG: hypothetical protein BWY79_01497 [Actinobacteria bacterium ADurb.Bin444]
MNQQRPITTANPTHPLVPDESQHHGRDQHGSQTEGGQGVRSTHTQRQQNDQHHQADAPREHEISTQAALGPPGIPYQGAECREQDQQKPQGGGARVEELSAQGELATAERANQRREHHAPQNHEGHNRQEQFGTEEAESLAEQGNGVLVAPKRGEPSPDHSRGQHQHRQQERGKPGDHARRREGVNRRHHPGAREKRAEHGEQESHRGERYQPQPMPVLALRDDDGVEQGGGGEPGDEGGILHGVPGPIATPSQGDVGPPRPHHIADGEKQPPGERPPPQRRNPRGHGVARGEARHHQRERYGHGHIAQVEGHWMHHHPRMQQHGVEAQPVRRQRREWIRGEWVAVGAEEQEEREEKRHGRERGHKIGGGERGAPPRSAGGGEGHGRQDQEPQQKRTGIARPNGRDCVGQRQGSRAVLENVEIAEVPSQESRQQKHHGAGCGNQGTTESPHSQPRPTGPSE